MTKRDFELLADCFAGEERKRWPDKVPDEVLYLAKNIAYNLRLSHPRFNESKFMAACFPLAEQRAKMMILGKVTNPQRPLNERMSHGDTAA